MKTINTEIEKNVYKQEAKAVSELVFIKTTCIDANPQQPRRVFSKENLHELSSSIAKDGVLQPLIVVENDLKTGGYTLVAGERRLRASELAGLEKVPVLIKKINVKDRLRIALLENIQRSDLNVVEEAMGYQSLIEDYAMTQEECARSLGKSRTTVTNSLRLLQLPSEIQQDLLNGRLSMGHARALLSLGERGLILKARSLIIEGTLSVRATEKLCRDLQKKNGTKDEQLNKPSKDPNLDYVAQMLREKLQTRVQILGGTQKGRIEISFFSRAELERVMGIISP